MPGLLREPRQPRHDPPHGRRGPGAPLLFQGPDVSWASTGHEAFTARTARVCLDCGHVMTFFSQTQLAKLRARLSEVTALVPPEDDD